MNVPKVNNKDELPLMLNASLIKDILGLSLSGAYALMQQKDFPVLRIGGKLLSPRDKFFEWIDKKTLGKGD